MRLRRIGDLPKFTQLESGRAGVHTWMVWPQSPRA